MKLRLIFFLAGILLLACNQQGEGPAATGSEPTLFSVASSEETGLDFENRIDVTQEFDVFRYRNYYNGGGVAIGDVNNDGLSDIFLTSNAGPNRLFLNKGDFTFEDISDNAGIAGTKAWSTGVAMVDLNADGWLDIYVCNSGDIAGDDKENELFINNQDGTFTERASEYGLADSGFSTHTVFFDYDKDGDLDCYVLNNSFRPISTLGYQNLRNERDEKGGDKLYRNEQGSGGIFKDVSAEAGIYGSVIGFGLGVTVGDVNLDGWPDIYVSNDFYERDYLYINQKNGAFREELPAHMGHTSHFSMGADIGDLNNDRFPEIFVTDMLPETLERTKQTTAFQTWDEYQLYQRNGLYHQFMRNTLQLNNGPAPDREGAITFSEIGQVVGVDATDWSWGALLADLDNNGFRDILVCNGVYKDVTDQDFVNFLASDENIKAAQMGQKIDFKAFVERMPSTKISNYLFANYGALDFRNKTREWGLEKESHSNGAAYGDLDNDGDLDLVISNVNDQLSVYRNHASETTGHNYLKFTIRAGQQNTYGLGARVLVYAGGQEFSYEHMPIKGFQSSMDYVPVIGIGAAGRVDSVLAIGPYGEVIRLGASVAVNSTVELDFSQATPEAGIYDLLAGRPGETVFSAEPAVFGTAAPQHRENFFVDFDRDRLVYHMTSREGPALATGDINSDGIADYYLGGAHGSPGRLFVFNPGQGRYEPALVPAFTADQDFEDVAAAFFDADGDGDLDLYVASGGNEFLLETAMLSDRLYFNESEAGQLRFVRREEALPRYKRITACVTPFDYDGDGDLDLFTGERLDLKGYGLPASGFLFENDGKGLFTDVTARQAPGLRNIGLITHAATADLDGNGAPDLVVVGEWMPVTVFYNENGRFPKNDHIAIPNSEGFWKKVVLADLDQDQQVDLLVCNLGLNSRFRGDTLRPMKLYVKDFDNNGSYEQIYCLTENGQTYPMVLKGELGKQLPMINKKFNTFAEYKDKTVTEVFSEEELADAYVATAVNFRSTVFLNRGRGRWQEKPLPLEAQFSPMQGVAVRDFNGDGLPDVVLAGNFGAAKPEVGRYDASYGVLLFGTGAGSFRSVPAKTSGLMIRGEVRNIEIVDLPGDRSVLLIAKNNDAMEALLWNKTFAVAKNDLKD